jgi:uncharacterized protein YbaP (TraB family)
VRFAFPIWRAQRGDSNIIIVGETHRASPYPGTMPDQISRFISSADGVVLELGREQKGDLNPHSILGKPSTTGWPEETLIELELFFQGTLLLRQHRFSGELLTNLSILNAGALVSEFSAAKFGRELPPPMFVPQLAGLSGMLRATIADEKLLAFESVQSRLNLGSECETQKKKAEFLLTAARTFENRRVLEIIFYEKPRALLEYDSAKVISLEEEVLNLDLHSPLKRECFLDSRNASWVERTEVILKSKRNLFLVVGLAHLLGTNSYLTQLEQRGFSISRVEL